MILMIALSHLWIKNHSLYQKMHIYFSTDVEIEEDNSICIILSLVINYLAYKVY